MFEHSDSHRYKGHARTQQDTRYHEEACVGIMGEMSRTRGTMNLTEACVCIIRCLVLSVHYVAVYFKCLGRAIALRGIQCIVHYEMGLLG